jgi:DNA-binding LacI/PurR family transcriptional regulator
VPQDISLVGFDDVPEAAYYSPPLTTVRPDFTAVAQASLDLLLEHFVSGRPAAGQHVLPPELIVRDSVAAPPR